MLIFRRHRLSQLTAWISLVGLTGLATGCRSGEVIHRDGAPVYRAPYSASPSESSGPASMGPAFGEPRPIPQDASSTLPPSPSAKSAPKRQVDGLIGKKPRTNLSDPPVGGWSEPATPVSNVAKTAPAMPDFPDSPPLSRRVDLPSKPVSLRLPEPQVEATPAPQAPAFPEIDEDAEVTELAGPDLILPTEPETPLEKSSLFDNEVAQQLGQPQPVEGPTAGKTPKRDIPDLPIIIPAEPGTMNDSKPSQWRFGTGGSADVPRMLPRVVPAKPLGDASVGN